MAKEMSNKRLELAEIKGLFMELNDVSTEAFTNRNLSETEAREYYYDIGAITGRIYDKIANLKKSE